MTPEMKYAADLATCLCTMASVTATLNGHVQVQAYAFPTSCLDLARQFADAGATHVVIWTGGSTWVWTKPESPEARQARARDRIRRMLGGA